MFAEQTAPVVDAPHHFEPLLPSPRRREPLLAKAHDLARAATALTGRQAPDDLRRLLRAMNSYYSNRIGGQHTRPFELAQALKREFSADAALAARQRLAVAHIDAEVALEQAFQSPEAAQRLYTVPTVLVVHEALFSRLPAADLVTPEGAAVAPGALRERDVSVGRHVAPRATAAPLLLARWCEVQGGVRRGDAALVAMAAAHQRLGWIHPFLDGNGRMSSSRSRTASGSSPCGRCTTSVRTGTALERGEFKRMTGLGERTAGTLLAALLKRELLASDSPQGKLRFGLPHHALRFYFPALWPEAEADAPADGPSGVARIP